MCGPTDENFPIVWFDSKAILVVSHRDLRNGAHGNLVVVSLYVQRPDGDDQSK